MSGVEPKGRLDALKLAATGCHACRLESTRNQVVFGEGHPEAAVMFIGEAPGKAEDELGRPFIGRSGMLLDRLFEECGIDRSDVFITSIVKCRPPDNRDPKRDEIASCQNWIESQIRLINPTVICTLGNFALKLIRNDPTGITQVHGQEEIRTVFGSKVWVYPLFHPAAALRSTTTRELLKADLERVNELALRPIPSTS
ncbi:MAG: uracil-DNA glycosylase [Solirubrobacterales bacterium]|nr:uracil-DNA glycosylase [Solirubrobacterales bacterium]